MTAAKLLAESVHYRYRPNEPVLEALSLEVNSGDRVAILGESGSGKSTVVGLLCGLAVPDRGRVTLDGRTVYEIPHSERKFSLVPQRPNPVTYLTGRELLSRPASRQPDGLGRIEEAVRKLGFDVRLLARKLPDLSGGELQLLYLARTFVWNPAYVFLDEPFNSIDVSHKTAHVYPSVIEMQKATGCGMVLVTHDPREALLMCGRLIVMRRGRKVADDASQELFSRPPDTGTALLIRGTSTNLLDVEISFDSNSTAIIRSVIGELRGRFVPDGATGKPNERVLGLFPWEELVPGNLAQGGSGVHRGAQSPTVLVVRDVTVYAVTGSSEGDVHCVSREVVLYDRQSKMLIGRIAVQSP